LVSIPLFHDTAFFSQIKAHSSVAGHMLYDLEKVNRSSSTEPIIILIDTTGYVFSGAYPNFKVMSQNVFKICIETLTAFVFRRPLFLALQ
jgi:hypothetical protein